MLFYFFDINGKLPSSLPIFLVHLRDYLCGNKTVRLNFSLLFKVYQPYVFTVFYDHEHFPDDKALFAYIIAYFYVFITQRTYKFYKLSRIGDYEKLMESYRVKFFLQHHSCFLGAIVF